MDRIHSKCSNLNCFALKCTFIIVVYIAVDNLLKYRLFLSLFASNILKEAFVITIRVCLFEYL